MLLAYFVFFNLSVFCVWLFVLYGIRPTVLLQRSGIKEEAEGRGTAAEPILFI